MTSNDNHKSQKHQQKDRGTVDDFWKLRLDDSRPGAPKKSSGVGMWQNKRGHCGIILDLLFLFFSGAVEHWFFFLIEGPTILVL